MTSIDIKLYVILVASFLCGNICDVSYENNLPLLGLLMPLIALLILFQVKKDLNTTSSDE
jgi:cell shape-determining protein MreD